MLYPLELRAHLETRETGMKRHNILSLHDRVKREFNNEPPNHRVGSDGETVGAVVAGSAMLA
jgi:hypothetical protein